jgi:hypothetical protein
LVAGDPLWLPHRYDPIADAVHFRHVSRADHSAATFLTDEELGPAAPTVEKRADAMTNAPAAAPIHFIFHSAFCGSTLLARALDIEGVAMALKEPVILNDLVGWRHRGGDTRQIARTLDHAMALLARPFTPGESVIVKPSNVVNAFAPAMLAMRPTSGALLLYAPLETYVASIAKKGMWGRLWVRDLLIKQIKDGLIDLGFTQDDYLAHTDLQAAAVGWVAQHALFARLIEAHGPHRIRTLDSETLVAQPERAMAALADLYGLTLDAAAVASGPVFTRHSKFGTVFGASEREAEHRAAIEAHGDEIEKVVIWAQAVARAANVSLDLKVPLLA